jgi:hypothetical protein
MNGICRVLKKLLILHLSFGKRMEQINFGILLKTGTIVLKFTLKRENNEKIAETVRRGRSIIGNFRQVI